MLLSVLPPGMYLDAIITSSSGSCSAAIIKLSINSFVICVILLAFDFWVVKVHELFSANFYSRVLIQSNNCIEYLWAFFGWTEMGIVR